MISVAEPGSYYSGPACLTEKNAPWSMRLEQNGKNA